MDGAMDATMMAPWCFDFYNRSELRHRRDWTCPGAALAPSSLIIAPLARSCARRDTDHTHAAGIGAERYQPWAPVHRHLCTPRIDQEGLRPEVDACPRPRKRPRALALVHRHLPQLLPHLAHAAPPSSRRSGPLARHCNRCVQGVWPSNAAPVAVEERNPAAAKERPEAASSRSPQAVVGAPPPLRKCLHGS